MKNILRFISIVGVCGSLTQLARAEVTAFPGAEGYARHVTGGRGHDVVHVTNLNDAGPGSFREAVSKSGRMVVFDVGGYINVTGGQIVIESDITVAGQSAPGDGIGILGSSVSLSGSHNVIVRHMRFRQGLAEKQERKCTLNINKGRDIILDHLSLQWGRWDVIGMTECENMTVQNCIIGPGVAPQRFGCLCESDNVTFSHNLWISNQSRNPKGKGKIQYVNNVVYNWGVSGYVGGHSAADHFADLINNYFIAGPNSKVAVFVDDFKATDHIYQTGNFADIDRDGQLNGRPVTVEDFGKVDPPTLVEVSALKVPTEVTIDSAAEALKKVIATAGASLHRDAVDTRLIDDLKSFGKTGSTVRDPQEMGGPQTLTGGTSPKDTDQDGMPDAWEQSHKLDLNNPADAKLIGADGYTELEKYLNSLCEK